MTLCPVCNDVGCEFCPASDEDVSDDGFVWTTRLVGDWIGLGPDGRRVWIRWCDGLGLYAYGTIVGQHRTLLGASLNIAAAKNRAEALPRWRPSTK